MNFLTDMGVSHDHSDGQITAGAFVTIEDHGYRLRRLPISSHKEPLPQRYSARSASTGSTRVIRRAGK
jgi:hypothetical protein